MTDPIDPEIVPFLQIYPQWSWHDNATICGTRPALIAMREAIDRALADTDGVSLVGDVFANDGEGYDVAIHVLPLTEMRRLSPYYSDPNAKGFGDGFWPHHLPVQPTRPEAVATADQPAAYSPKECGCHQCRPISMDPPEDMRMIVCPDCGNKRCPKANDHRNACTGSNAPGQEGSAYP